jgi:hypothetical protein
MTLLAMDLPAASKATTNQLASPSRSGPTASAGGGVSQAPRTTSVAAPYRHTERLVVIAGLDSAGRLAAMRVCADEKLVALGLDASARKQLRAGATPP